MEQVVTINPKVLGGTPCFAGTRVPVKSLFDHLEGGYNVDDFLKQFPSVQRSQVMAVLENSRLNAEKVDTYAAVGQLQASSLQYGSQTLYRLVDPANGRTVVYLRTSDPKTADMIGQFVGVRGELVDDDQLNLKVIPFTDITPVDSSLVNTKIQAEFIPPSMIGHGVQASTGN